MEKTDTPAAPSVALPERCCGRCAHAYPIHIPTQLATLWQCRLAPPVPVLMPAGPGQAPGVQPHWPILPAEAWCHQFASRPVPVTQ